MCDSGELEDIFHVESQADYPGPAQGYQPHSSPWRVKQFVGVTREEDMKNVFDFTGITHHAPAILRAEVEFPYNPIHDGQAPSPAEDLQFTAEFIPHIVHITFSHQSPQLADFTPEDCPRNILSVCSSSQIWGPEYAQSSGST